MKNFTIGLVAAGALAAALVGLAGPAGVHVNINCPSDVS